MSRTSTKHRQYIVKYSDFQNIFDIDQPTIGDWIKEGMPVFDDRESGRTFNIPECIQWYKNREFAKKLGNRLDPSQEVAKKTAVQTELLKLELAEKTKELIKAETVIKMWSDILTALRTKLLTIPKSFSQLFAGIEDEYIAEAELEKIIRDALNGLADKDNV